MGYYVRPVDPTVVAEREREERHREEARKRAVENAEEVRKANEAQARLERGAESRARESTEPDAIRRNGRRRKWPIGSSERAESKHEPVASSSSEGSKTRRNSYDQARTEAQRRAASEAPGDHAATRGSGQAHHDASHEQRGEEGPTLDRER